MNAAKAQPIPTFGYRELRAITASRLRGEDVDRLATETVKVLVTLAAEYDAYDQHTLIGALEHTRFGCDWLVANHDRISGIVRRDYAKRDETMITGILKALNVQFSRQATAA